MESEMPFDKLRSHRRQESADIDAHVENVVRPVFQVASRRVKIADHGRDVGLEEPVADHEANQRYVDYLQRLEGQEEMSGDEEHAAKHDRAAEAELPVGQKTAYQRASVDEH